MINSNSTPSQHKCDIMPTVIRHLLVAKPVEVGSTLGTLRIDGDHNMGSMMLPSRPAGQRLTRCVLHHCLSSVVVRRLLACVGDAHTICCAQSAFRNDGCAKYWKAGRRLPQIGPTPAIAGSGPISSKLARSRPKLGQIRTMLGRISTNFGPDLGPRRPRQLLGIDQSWPGLYQFRPELGLGPESTKVGPNSVKKLE